jgi:hypothetical protein
METVLVIIAVWLIVSGLYGISPLLRRRARLRLAVPRRAPAPPPEVLEPTAENPFANAVPLRPSQTTPPQSGLSGLFSEVDQLRVQVERLRSEVIALSGAMPGRLERPRRRRYSMGLYADLPRLLRQHVREVRSERRPLRA